MRLVPDSVAIETLIIFHHLSEPSAAKTTRTGNCRVYFREERGAPQVGVDRDGKTSKNASAMIHWDAYFDSNNYYHYHLRPESYSIRLHYEKYSF